ncbi:uncharacterized protein LODBEIA_P25780 [Lodderomyces beijingensis]|uniref:Globin domain-containing protein n=1 Tax=Lodderomyces beijingensis TaxID=1775926 RepID=A0ABP0ZJM6_9ASCO
MPVPPKQTTLGSPLQTQPKTTPNSSLRTRFQSSWGPSSSETKHHRSQSSPLKQAISRKAPLKDFDDESLVSLTSHESNDAASTIATSTDVGSIDNKNGTRHILPPIEYKLSTDLSQLAYSLYRVDTTESMKQEHLTRPERFGAKINLSQREIDMVRYTWNSMVQEERSSKARMPGQFPSEKTAVGSSLPRQATGSKNISCPVSLSLFCQQFYANALATAPELEKMFPSIKHQSVSFAGIMSLIISQLEDLSVLESYFVSLAKKHSRGLGIEPGQFEIMGEALIYTFKERFGEQFTLELEILWIKVYLFLANSLLQLGVDPIMKPEVLDGQMSIYGGANMHDSESMVTRSEYELRPQVSNTTTMSQSRDDRSSSHRRFFTRGTNTGGATDVDDAASSTSNLKRAQLQPKDHPVQPQLEQQQQKSPKKKSKNRKFNAFRRKGDCTIT